jgi:hypothetical protein
MKDKKKEPAPTKYDFEKRLFRKNKRQKEDAEKYLRLFKERLAIDPSFDLRNISLAIFEPIESEEPEDLPPTADNDSLGESDITVESKPEATNNIQAGAVESADTGFLTKTLHSLKSIVKKTNDKPVELDEDSIYLIEESEASVADTQSEPVPPADNIKRNHVSFDLERLLLDYVYENHMAIAYYERALLKRKIFRYSFLTFSILLLFFLPILVAKIPKHFAGGSEEMTALITAVLTGLIGIQKAIGNWMNQRQLIGIFWKASADLKENVYSLERKWSGNPFYSQKNIRELINDLERGVLRARGVIREEQKEHFATYKAATSVDLGGILSAASGQAGGLWKNFAAKTVQQEKVQLDNLANNEEKKWASQQLVQALEFKIDKLKELIGATGNSDADILAIKSYEIKLAKLKIELIEAEANLMF